MYGSAITGEGREAGRVLILGRSSSGSLEAMIARGFIRLGYFVKVLGYEDICGKPGFVSSVMLRRLLVGPAREAVIASIPCLRGYNKLAIEAVERFEPEIVLIVKGEAVSRVVLRRVLREGPSSLFYLNPDEPRFMGLTGLYSRAGFIVLTPCRPCVAWLRRSGVRAYFLPFAADIDPGMEWPGCRIRARAIAVLGTVYPNRLGAAKRLLAAGLPVIAAGPGWRLLVPGAGRGVYGTRYKRLLAAVYAVLNIHHGSDVGYKANMRVFEVPGAAGVLLSDNPGEVHRFYTHGEVYTFQSLEDLVNMAVNILEEPRENLCAVARRAFETTRRHHTYVHRAREIASLYTAP